MSQELYSVEQVAERLGLHVRTVRNYVRDGRLKAVRIGKQYRIARGDLEALTGRPVDAFDRDTVRPHRHVDVSSIVEIDAIDTEAAGRLTNSIIATANGRRKGEEPLRIETIYDPERARLKIIVVGGLNANAYLLKLVGVWLEAHV
jgi:excisionase family DNA binding protein